MSPCLIFTGTLNLQHAALLSWWAVQSFRGASGSGGSRSRCKAVEFGVSLASHPLKGADRRSIPDCCLEEPCLLQLQGCTLQRPDIQP